MSENMAQGFDMNIIFVLARERFEMKLPIFMMSYPLKF